MFREQNGKLWIENDGEILTAEAWGNNAIRVRATRNRCLTNEDRALDEKDARTGEIEIFRDPDAGGGAYANMYAGSDKSFGRLRNGKIWVEADAGGVLTFYNSNGKRLLKENFKRLRDEISAPLNILGREYKYQSGENWKIRQRFEAVDGEKIFGMGQYQQQKMNMKGCLLELAQRNSQVSIPFYVSDNGYGFLWNNPAIGEVMFAENGTEWLAESSKELDYLVIAGDSPAEIVENYMELTGKPPMMPEYGLGFWQCKLRYVTQEELLGVARRYHEEKIPLDVIVVDFFHWTRQGEFKFDPKYWPDVEGMCRELNEMGIRLMVSVWPTIDLWSENFAEMKEKGYLVQTNAGIRPTMLCGGTEVFYDATNPEAREYVWEKIKKNYWEKGAKLYWLDVAEPEYTSYDFDNYRYYSGSVLETGNQYPKCYVKGFYDGMKAAGDPAPVNLVRSAWVGSAQYGALVWSGDIVSNFECLRRQVKAGLSMAVSGIPWWTTDIGGFHGGDSRSEKFRELFVRWFAYGCFLPVMRLHGNRSPQKRFEMEAIGSGGDNEIWSFGEEVYEIAKRYVFLREKLREYIREQMKTAHEKGTPVMRPAFYDFPDDPEAWKVDDAYLFGPDLYVAPVMEEGMRQREVYLPKGTNWIDVWEKKCYQGGNIVCVPAPLDRIPVFAAEGSGMEQLFK